MEWDSGGLAGGPRSDAPGSRAGAVGGWDTQACGPGGPAQAEAPEAQRPQPAALIAAAGAPPLLLLCCKYPSFHFVLQAPLTSPSQEWKGNPNKYKRCLNSRKRRPARGFAANVSIC